MYKMEWDANAVAADRFWLGALFDRPGVWDEESVVGRVGAQRLFTSVLPKIRNRNTPPTTSSWVISAPGYLSKTSRCCFESLHKVEVFLLELMSPQTRTTVFLARFTRSFSLKTRWLKQLFDICSGAQALTLFNSVILPDAARIRGLGSLMMDVKGSLQPIMWNCNAFITVSTVTSCSVNIMTKLGANVHTLIGVRTRRSFSAWWCTEAENEAKRAQISPCSCAVADKFMEFKQTGQNDREQREAPSALERF